MTRATGLGALPELLAERASDRALRKTFAAESIPLEIIEHKDAFITFDSMVSLFDRAARAVGDRTFGLRVGEAMSYSDFGMWMNYSASARTLGGALQRATNTYRFHQTGGGLLLEVEGPYVVWRYHPPSMSDISIQHSDHILGPMMRFVSRFLGESWRASWIELNYRRDIGAEEIVDLLGSPVRFAQPCVGVAIDRELINRTNPNDYYSKRVREITFSEVKATYAGSSALEPLQSVLSIVALRLLGGKTDIDGAAEMVGIGVQPLQRMLRQNGLSYRDTVDMARSNRARALLHETNMAVIDIALDLGYTDHANFTRAFNRWLGCSPSEYRARAA